ncbi:transcription factor [Pyrrhoderma noxium]|uniref:Transcription factor n=1 Tax=Pyrrhoderma noxium TaxID=2282107 RepID=A0A286UG35_9AGAM|nr:transcription factor [Pyrrhoderma noxium]
MSSNWSSYDPNTVPTNGGTADDGYRVPRRTPMACTFCRGRKLKCDGRSICTNCAQRKLECVYKPVAETS